MDSLFDFLEGGSGDPSLALAGMIFVAGTLAAFGAMMFLQARGAFKRRTAGIAF